MWYPNDTFHYVFKAEFVTLVSLKVPSGFSTCSSPLAPSVEMLFVVEDIMEVNDQTFSLTVELKILMSWRDRRLSEWRRKFFF